MLILADAMAPGWKVEVDGEPIGRSTAWTVDLEERADVEVKIFDVTGQIVDRFEAAEARMGATADGDEIVRLAKEHAELKPVVEAARALTSSA